jgi:hypothetical protein
MTAYEQGDLLLEAALEKAERHANQVWLHAARQVVWQLIKAGEPFTTDDCWAHLDTLGVATHEPRALGVVMRAAAKAGLIRKAGYRNTTRPEAHSRPIPLWEPIRKADAA